VVAILKMKRGELDMSYLDHWAARLGTPIQRGLVPGGEFGGRGGVPEVYFPEGF
jgi:hypothetical protein